jgi:hypothetical protein
MHACYATYPVPSSLLELNYSIINAWRRMGKWRYYTTILDLYTRWRWVVSFTLLPVYPGYNQPRVPFCMGRLGGPPEPVWTLWRWEKSLASTGNWTPTPRSFSQHPSPYLSIYLSKALQSFVRPWPLFCDIILYTQSVGLLGREISPSQGLYLYTEQHKHRINAHRHPHLECDSNSRPQCSSGRRLFLP